MLTLAVAGVLLAAFALSLGLVFALLHIVVALIHRGGRTPAPQPTIRPSARAAGVETRPLDAGHLVNSGGDHATCAPSANA